MDRKYQVFISSTQRDLVEQRDAAVKAILRLGHIPVGMEMFNAADESSWKLIQRNIDASDFYIVILARRYGSTDGGVSFTEKEYDYATTKGIPAFGFELDEEISWPPKFTDEEPEAIKRLQAFKEKLRKSRQVSKWRTSEGLESAILSCLSTQIPLHQRDGWIRGNESTQPEVANEIARLSKENERLRKHVQSEQPPQLEFTVLAADVAYMTPSLANQIPFVRLLAIYKGKAATMLAPDCKLILGHDDGTEVELGPVAFSSQDNCVKFASSYATVNCTGEFNIYGSKADLRKFRKHTSLTLTLTVCIRGNSELKKFPITVKSSVNVDQTPHWYYREPNVKP